jgi:hypothetical protein
MVRAVASNHGVTNHGVTNMATKLSQNALRRIGQAVRTVEAGRGKGARSLTTSQPQSIRLALVASVTDGSPDEGDPYIYAVDIYAGGWDDTPAARSAIVEDAVLWSRTELDVGAWVAAIRVGNHWEAFAGAGGAAYERPADPTAPLVLGQDSEGTADDAATTPYDALSTSTANDGVSVWVCSRIRYDHAATTPKVYAYMTKLTWPKAIAPAATGQTRVEIEAPEAW